MRFKSRLRRLEAKHSPGGLEHLSDQELEDMIAYLNLCLEKPPSPEKVAAAEARLTPRSRAWHEQQAGSGRECVERHSLDDKRT